MKVNWIELIAKLCITSSHSKSIDINQYDDKNYNFVKNQIQYISQYFNKYCFRINHLNPKIEVYDFIPISDDKYFFLELKHLECVNKSMNLK